MRWMLGLVLLVLAGCGAVVEPPRCVLYESVAMANGQVNAGSLEVCVMYD